MTLLGSLMRFAGMPVCREMAEQMTRAIDGALTADEARAARRHLFLCADCRCFRRQLELTRDALGRTPPEPVPPSVHADLVAAFRARRAGRRDPGDLP